MDIEERRLTADAFREMAHDPQYADVQLELVRGEVRGMSPSSGLNSKLAARILVLIFQHVEVNALGDVTGADGGYQLDEHTVRVPDVGFIARERVPEEAFVPGAPDLAVEVISPSESAAAPCGTSFVRSGSFMWSPSARAACSPPAC
ncbi:MAG: Uma2 family endonuclease [Anaerolineae bacterium]